MKNLRFTKMGLIYFLIILFIYNSCSDDKDGDYLVYNPNKPIELTHFFPDSGGISTQVILEGANFGTDTANVKVYFNEKEAFVVSVKGNKMYVLPPRLPGDICEIKVQIGDNFAVADNHFKYTARRTVSTVAGQPNAPDEFRPGSLSTALFRSFKGIAIDDEDNIFFSLDGNNVGRLNLTENVSEKIYDQMDLNGLAIDPATQKVIYVSNWGTGLLELNPLTLWTPRVRQIENISNDNCQWKHAMVVHEGKGYVRAAAGQIIEIDMKTYEGKILGMDQMAHVDNWGMAIDPLQPNMLYISYIGKHLIRTINLNDIDDQKTIIGSEGVSGWRDGPGRDAELNTPRQICFDKEGYLYIADKDNHCIRQYDRDGMVTTIAGIPREWGHADGSPEEAKFCDPTGICVDRNGDIYVGEAGANKTLRRITLE